MNVFLFVCNIWVAEWYNASVECYSKEYFSGCQLSQLCVVNIGVGSCGGHFGHIACK